MVATQETAELVKEGRCERKTVDDVSDFCREEEEGAGGYYVEWVFHVLMRLDGWSEELETGAFHGED